ncbi:MAG: radical SAM protein [Candidatus Methanofastidiosia archaeon]
MKRWLKDFKNCKLCCWKCDVDRLNGEIGVCGITLPMVAQSCLHPAPPASFDAFLVGCNFRCSGCQNYTISTYPENPNSDSAEFIEPFKWAELAFRKLSSIEAKLMGADRMFFTGGEPTCHLPWIEEVVRHTNLKVNFDTNGFMTRKSLKRVLSITTSITYDLKAFRDKTHRILTGAPVEPVLSNAEYILKYGKEKLYEFRVLVVEGVVEKEVSELVEWLASIDEDVKVCFLAFRPNFVLDRYFGASQKVMREVLKVAQKKLLNVSISGFPGISGHVPFDVLKLYERLKLKEDAKLISAFNLNAGCVMPIRNCGVCKMMLDCKLKRFAPKRRT